ncbi:MAG: C1 family peptidase [Candidatus Izemoplasmatales bacterium]|nr:C1 family peptidase [Candidatus Izemoplasmatales bacterium]
MKKINNDLLENWKKEYDQDVSNLILQRALNKNEMQNIALKQESKQVTTFNFSKEIKTLPVANQEKSGRCWIFAGLNVLREIIAKTHNLKEFELSQNYIAFYDKLEKINYFLESVDDFIDSDKDDRTLQHIVRMGIQDGGQWDMFVSLVEKYGLVPKDAMDETANSSSTRIMNQFINLKLRKYVALSRKNPSKKNELKSQTLKELYGFLISNFGAPPKEFDFEFVDKDNNYNIINNLNPMMFKEKYVGNILEDYISIIHAPTEDKPFYKSYTVEYLGNVIEGRIIKYLNLDMDSFKTKVLNQLNDGEVVWFGSDVGHYGDRELGVWADDRYDYSKVFRMDFDLDKGAMLDFGHSQMNHAMVITGYTIINGKPLKYKIQNSWGDKTGKKGYYLASDSWFDKFVYQAVINKKYLTEKELKIWEEEPVKLKPWDPMGSLAD